MFRMFRSSHVRSPYGASTVDAPVDVNKALAVERAVRELPDLQRAILRGWYVRNEPPWVICRSAAIPKRELQLELSRARTMARNRLN